MINRQKIGVAVVAIFFAVIFFRLGLWQLDKAQLMQEISKPQAERGTVALLSVAQPNESLSNDALSRIVQVRGTYLSNLQAPNQEDVNGKVGTWLVGVLQVEGSGKIAIVRGISADSLPISSESIQVVGRLMPSQINNKYGEVKSGFLPRIDSALLLSEFGSDFFDGYIIAQSEQPEIEIERVPSPIPVIKVSGFYWQHISYVVVWWLMALLALALPLIRSKSESQS
ncbi:MAG: SURF1 family cytochrome oxidase biogenesis protein [Actinomycetota bacterium]